MPSHPPGHLGDKAGSLAGSKHLLILFIIKTGLFLVAPDLQICLAKHILFLPFSVGEESPNVRNKKVTAFRILEKEVGRCTAQKGHHFFVAERINPLHPVAPPFHFSFLLFYHILLYERCTCFASVNCAPSTIRKRTTPPRCRRKRPLTHLRSAAFLSALIRLRSAAPCGIAGCTAGSSGHAGPAAAGGCPAPEFYRGTAR